MGRLKLVIVAVGALVVGSSLGTNVAQARDYVFEGNSYCWYFDGWRGPGWYRCGFQLRRGFGWGGPSGWHGWGGGAEFREGRTTTGRGGGEVRERSGAVGRGGAEFRERSGGEVRERGGTAGRGGAEFRGQGGVESRSGGGNANAPRGGGEIRGGSNRENR